MFTGIIEEVGAVSRIQKTGTCAMLTVRCQTVLSDVRPGDSIAVNGICLTVTGYDASSFTADVMHETLNRTALSRLHTGSPVNLERAMPADGRFGGHIVTGHIDGTGRITGIRQDSNAVWYTIQAPPGILRLVVEKGSIAIDGISLTVASLSGDSFQVSVIPHTLAHTSLAARHTGDPVNLENDCIAKYVEKFVSAASGGTITKEFLSKYEF
ncbi:MAG: riboflavin synthase [Lachnospiraceae bacterium]|nr:riboflavin synthase [Lachnospiraceae bacterium]